MEPLLDIRDLHVQFATDQGCVRAVSGVSLSLQEGEILAIVGESGSGKSVSMLSIMGLIPCPPGKIVSGQVLFRGTDLLRLPPADLRGIRGREIAMIFQDPMTSLNPVMTVGNQIDEAIKVHLNFSDPQARARTIELLSLVGIPDAAARRDDYPHQFSGGMRQRVMIAMALSCNPKMLIADEPTTALDVTIQAQIVALVKKLQREFGMSVVWITHDLGVVASIANRVAVMYGGRVMEVCQVDEAYRGLRHPYTQALLKSIPRLNTAVAKVLPEIHGVPVNITADLRACPFEPRCQYASDRCRQQLPALEPTDQTGHYSACWHWKTLAEHEQASGEAPTDAAYLNAVASDVDTLVTIQDLKVHFPIRTGGLFGRKQLVKAVDGVDLLIERGKTTGLVGESGCGKTTLGQAVLRLCDITAGKIMLEGQDLAHLKAGKLRATRRRMQLIFQDPYAAMNPRMRIGQVISEPLVVNGMRDKHALQQRVAELLDNVGLNPAYADRYPHEFSGGQRQRVVIARALALNSELIICDEPVSSLDVSIQAQIINLLKALQERYNLTYLFIAHDLAMVRHISDRVAIMYLGKIVEIAPKDRIYDAPQHPYTQALLSSVPIPDPVAERKRQRRVLEGDLPSPIAPPSGCRFHTRCPIALKGTCEITEPALREVQPGHWAACHLISA
jgi:peptide/nickel transport system ATP-binding protein